MNTIVALATPPIKSTIHIIRLSGPESFNIINKICNNKVSKKGNTIQNVKIFNNLNNKIIDDVLLMKFVAPKSFTGEDLIEINCHGNMIIVNKIIDLILKNGAKNATPGEFTKQAFLNNKLDISQANSINYLINAQNEFQYNVSLDNVLGKSKNKIKELKNSLFQIIGTLKVNIDYPEYYDVEDISNKKILNTLEKIDHILNDIIDKYLKNFFLFNNINLVILGKPNSGKSSLLNALLNYERAIVSKTKGTTRDFIKETININNLNFNIMDTAGIRLSKNQIEKKGISKGIEISKKADLILYVIDTSIVLKKDEIKWVEDNLNKKFLIVKNKIDLGDKNKKINGIKISAKNNNIDDLKKELSNFFSYNKNDNFFIVSDYEKNFLLEIKHNIKKAITLIKKNYPQDIVLEDIEYAYILFKKFLGEDKNLDILDELFKNFCLGK